MQAPAAAETAAEPVSLKVLLIEDNPLDARLIGIMLREAANGTIDLELADRMATGLKRLRQGGIDLVLVDLSLPDSHGLESFAQVQALAQGMPIIVLSGLADETVAVRAVHEGAQDYLVKGQVSGPLLVRAMRYAIERKRTSEQLARYAEELRKKNAQMEADFQMAREIQQMFLPQWYPTFPASAAPEQSALRFYHRYQPAAAVGGDFFNILSITNTMAGLFICDVMGHGMRAALVTAILRGLVEELIPLAMDAGKFMGEINRSLHAILRRTSEPLLATAAYLIADIDRAELRFASAGHPSPFRLRRDLASAEPLKTYDSRHGPALGLFEDTVFPICRCPLAPGDLIVLFTDGLYEVNGRAEEEYGLERLLAAVRRRVRLPADQIFDELLADVRQFGGRDDFEDDVCLVGMEIMRTAVIGDRR